MSLFRYGFVKLGYSSFTLITAQNIYRATHTFHFHGCGLNLQSSLKNSVSMAASLVTQATGGSRPAQGKNVNKLIESKSPYLLQHAYNPVNWYPWGEEAFKKAQEENKLIFLSVGYSTCHWCHVMEHESFESEAIASLMNEDFINIKVDREERPDVDKLYMSFVQAISGRGGWPMSVWLTPDLKPVYGGTYYPPNDRYYEQPGFASILKSLSKQWKENPEKFKSSGGKIIDALKQAAKIGCESELPSASVCIEQCYDQLKRSYEPRFGGFSKAPKFPQPVNLSFLLRLHARGQCDNTTKQQAFYMCLQTLRMMAKGGIFDHVCLGFARYSTDEKWHVPHFEKMLYDQAQLACVYTDAYTLKKSPDLARVVRDILTYVNESLSDPSGGFYSAEDADSLPEHGSKKKREGAFCVWTYDDIHSLLSTLSSPADASVADIICHHFDIQPLGNVDPYQDPHDELKGQNVLIVRGGEEETAAKFGISVDLLQEGVLKPALSIMRTARERRPAPHLDDKMVAAWNGLMISGFARAGIALNEEAYVQRAIKAARFMKTHLYNPESGRLLRSCYRGIEESVSQISTPIDGFLDDYAFTIRALLDLYTACQEDEWISWADQLQKKQDELFWDSSEGGYFTSSADDKSILIRLKEDQDGAEPSGNSIAVGNLERLSVLVDWPEYRESAARILRLFGDRLTKVPISLPEMVSGLMLHQDSPTEVLIVGPRSSPETMALYKEAVHHWRSLLGLVLIQVDPEDSGRTSFILARKPWISSIKTPGAYLCRERTCSLPVSSPVDLRRLLDDSGNQDYSER